MPRRDRFLTGLLGRDIGASRSPWLHEGEADALGLRLAYTPLDFAALGLDEADLPRMLTALALAGYSGVNVTHPYKQAIIPYLDTLDPAAARIGAVNTVHFAGGRSLGHNTDYAGFLEGLRRHIAPERCADVVQLGAGGAGSATAQAILDHGRGTLTIADPSQGHRQALFGRLVPLYGEERVRIADDVAAALAGADGLVNASPVGMAGYPGSPVPLDLLRPDLWVADVIYFPAETELLRAARARGCDSLDGVAMVVFQAAAAFAIFTGVAPDPERMLARLRDRLDAEAATPLATAPDLLDKFSNTKGTAR